MVCVIAGLVGNSSLGGHQSLPSLMEAALPSPGTAVDLVTAMLATVPTAPGDSAGSAVAFGRTRGCLCRSCKHTHLPSYLRASDESGYFNVPLIVLPL